MITYEDREYAEIIEFDCRIISLVKIEGNTFSTVLPISPLSWREKHTTCAAVDVKKNAKDTRFLITDDWGSISVVTITNDHKKEIETAIEAARKDGLLKED